MLRTEAAEGKTRTRILARAPYRVDCLCKSGYWAFPRGSVSFQALSCLAILMTSKWVASGPRPTPFLTLLCNLNLPASNSACLMFFTHTKMLLPLGWFAAFLGGNLIVGYLWDAAEARKESRKKPQWPQFTGCSSQRTLI